MDGSYLCTKFMQEREDRRFTLGQDNTRVQPSWGGCGPHRPLGQAAPASQEPCGRGEDQGRDRGFGDQRHREVGRGRRRTPGNHQRDLWWCAAVSALLRNSQHCKNQELTKNCDDQLLRKTVKTSRRCNLCFYRGYFGFSTSEELHQWPPDFFGGATAICLILPNIKYEMTRKSLQHSYPLVWPS